MTGLPKQPYAAVVLHSGGLDSTVLLYHVVKSKAYAKHDILALGVCYGARTELYEEACAEASALQIQVPRERVYLTRRRGYMPATAFGQAVPDCALTNVPSRVPNGLEDFEVLNFPARNLWMIALAATYAPNVYVATHEGGEIGALAEDARSVFINAADAAAFLCSPYGIRVHAPFQQMDKAQIIRIGSDLHVPFESTYTCHRGLRHHCGQCGVCCDRKTAFQIAGIPDPTRYIH